MVLTSLILGAFGLTRQYGVGPALERPGPGGFKFVRPGVCALAFWPRHEPAARRWTRRGESSLRLRLGDDPARERGTRGMAGACGPCGASRGTSAGGYSARTGSTPRPAPRRALDVDPAPHLEHLLHAAASDAQYSAHRAYTAETINLNATPADRPATIVQRHTT